MEGRIECVRACVHACVCMYVCMYVCVCVCVCVGMAHSCKVKGISINFFKGRKHLQLFTQLAQFGLQLVHAITTIRREGQKVRRARKIDIMYVFPISYSSTNVHCNLATGTYLQHTNYR